MQRLSLDLVRRSNLSMVLRLVHRDRSLSRAAITRLTGLSRSTVGALLSDLAAADLVGEREPAAVAQVGRPSATVVPSPSIAVAAVEIAPDGVQVALGGLGGTIFTRSSAHTSAPPSPARAAELTADLVRTAISRLEQPARLFGVTSAVVGRVDPDDQVVVTSSELGWEDVPFAELLTEAIGRPATVCYRTQLAAVAEQTWGAARDIDNLVYLHGAAAGIGGVVIADSELLRGGAGLAARVGHLFVGDHGPECSCGSRGCLMALVTEQELRDQLAVAGSDQSEDPDHGIEGLDLRVIDAPGLADLVERDLRYLQTALRMMMVAYDPDAIVLGGFLTPLLRAGAQRLTDELAASKITNVRSQPRLLEPTLGSDQVLLGATHRAFGDLLDDPLGSGASALAFV